MDRAALDFALDRGIPHGGYCPKGRLAEDGRLPDLYQLDETDSEDYAVRTEKNVLAAQGTLILYRQRMTGGTQLTHQLCVLHHKPCFLINLEDPPSRLRQTFLGWLIQKEINTLNIAGQRESHAPGIYAQSKKLLGKLF